MYHKTLHFGNVTVLELERTDVVVGVYRLRAVGTQPVHSNSSVLFL